MWQAKPIDLDPDLVVDGSALSILINSGSSNCALAAESKVKPVKPGQQWRPYSKAAETVQPAAAAKATPSVQQTTLSQHMRKGPTSSSESPIGSMPNLDADTTVAISATQLQEESQPASKRGCHRQTASVDPTDAAASLAAASSVASSTAAATKKPAKGKTPPASKSAKRPAPDAPNENISLQVAASKNKQRVHPCHQAASAETQRKYGDKEVRIPRAMFPDEPEPAEGYWVATVGKFADAKKTVWLTISGESPFWRYSKELCELELHA